MDLLLREKIEVVSRAQTFLALDRSYDAPQIYASTKKSISYRFFPTIIKVVPTGSRAERLFLESSDQDYIIECGPVLVDPPDPGYRLMSFFTKRRDNFYCKATPNPGFYVVYDDQQRSVPPATVQMCIAPYLVSAASGTSILNELKNQNHAKAALPEALSFGNKDDVVALKLSKWPNEMKETLMGRLQWLSSECMEAVAAAELYLVRKSHPKSDDPELEWRLSFSMLEIEIVKRIGEVQRRGYLLAKQFLKIVDKASVTASYELKNTMLWLLHEQVWASQCTDAGRFMWSLLERLHQFYTKETLPNFFIPEQNLLELKLTQEMVGFRAMLGSYISNRDSMDVLQICASTIISDAVFFHKEYLVTYLDDVKVFRTGIAVELYVSALKDLNCIFTFEALKQEVDEKRLRKAVQLLHDAWFVLAPETCTERGKSEACMVDIFKSVRDCIPAYMAKLTTPQLDNDLSPHLWILSKPSVQGLDYLVTTIMLWNHSCWEVARIGHSQLVFEKVADHLFEYLKADLVAVLELEKLLMTNDAVIAITQSIMTGLRVFSLSQKLRLRSALASTICTDLLLAECCMLSGMFYFQSRFLKLCMDMCNERKAVALEQDLLSAEVAEESGFHSVVSELLGRHDTESQFWKCIHDLSLELSKGLAEAEISLLGAEKQRIRILSRCLDDIQSRFSLLNEWLYGFEADVKKESNDLGVRASEKMALIQEIVTSLGKNDRSAVLDKFADATSALPYAVSHLCEAASVTDAGGPNTTFRYPDALYLINWNSFLKSLGDPTLYLMFKDMYKYKERNEGRKPFKFELPSVLEYLIYKAQYLCEHWDSCMASEKPHGTRPVENYYSRMQHGFKAQDDGVSLTGCWVFRDGCIKASDFFKNPGGSLIYRDAPLRAWDVDLSIDRLALTLGRIQGLLIENDLSVEKDLSWERSYESLFGRGL